MNIRYLNMVLRTAPYLKRDLEVHQIMRNVVYALLPIIAFAIYCFGLSVLALVLVATFSCVITEVLVCKACKKENSCSDNSAYVTGILLGLTLPPGFPLWMAFVGGVVSILLGKLLFGGLGYNVFNPALLGRAFLQAAFPAAITTWVKPFSAYRFTDLIPSTFTLPFTSPVYDAVTSATPLALMKFEQKTTGLEDLFIGGVSGSAGEGSALLIICCGAYLAFRKMLDWRIPAAILFFVFIFSAVFYVVDQNYPSPFFMFFSGGLMLGAVFMATDMVTSPVTSMGILIYSALIAFLVVIIRLFGGMPEGVMYAILFANALVPLIHRITQPSVYGAQQ